MKKFTAIFLFIFCNFYTTVIFAEKALTVKQQLDRLMQEVSDLNKAVFNKSFDIKDLNLENKEVDVERFTSIDIRIYDLEKDIKNLTLQFEEIIFKLDDLNSYIERIENDINLNLEEIKNSSNFQKNSIVKNDLRISSNEEEDNTLGKLVLSEDNKQTNDEKEVSLQEQTEEQELNNLSPEEQLQLALDQMMKKDYNKSKITLEKFIEKFPKNNLSGSAHFWLGKIFQFESNHRQAAIIFGEGVQKFPSSIKAAEMYYELTKSLKEMNKLSEACKTLDILIQNYKGSKFSKDPENIKGQLKCEVQN